MNYTSIIEYLRNEGVRFESGLSEDEVRAAEMIYDIVFPPDFKELLMTALPITNGFYNWRDNSESNILKIKDRFEFVEDGFLFDIEHNAFWLDEWGEKPQELEKAYDICREELRKVPKMIPINGHRYLPSNPCEANNPVFSIYQTDIIYYGENIIEYLKLEFGLKDYENLEYDKIKKINFWVNLQE